MTGKKRGRPPKVNTNEKPKFQYHLLKKPKYLSDKKSDSQISTPSVSRASSPQDSEESRRSSTRISQTKSRSRPVSSKKQTKTKANKKNTPAYHKTDYFYGSDFEDENSENEENASSSSSNDDDLIDNASDSEFSLSSYSSLTGAQKQSNSPCLTPEPLWLQDIDLPQLELPETSDDLLVPHEYVLRALSIYEILRRFHSMVRLSPYRFEDFCAALICEEQSVLLAELHIMLLKAILREEDSQQTHFGPLDQKDSVNIVLYLIDSITWPEVLRSYVESDASFDKNVLQILTTKEYPYTSIEDRLTVLQFLSDQFLTSTTVRDDMLREGPIHYDDHCRICHKLGDLLCCETCPAVFHLECVDPPLADVPTEDWQCALCKIHKIPGVADCVLSQEKQGVLCRQSSLGCDRHGRKYWFVCRRLFVEELDGSRMWYYSSVPQLEILISRLDKDDMENYLYKSIMEWKEDIEKQMKVTEDLTNKNKGSKKSHLELLNEKIKQVSEDTKTKSDNNGDNNESNTDEIRTPKATKSDTPCEVEKSIQTRSKTGSLTPRTFSIDDLRRRSSTAVSTKKEDLQREIELLSQAFKSPYFKLGMEGGFKTYVNQYNVNPTALNKPQRNEDRDKKRHLSHKFSLTPASEFKWTGQLNGTASTVLSTLKQTLIGFEQGIAPQFMHPNWQKIKRLWSNAISLASCQEDIANITVVLQSCLRNVIFANVWYEQLGHLQLFRITSLEREERKKIEKREKREKDDEEERFRLQYNFVKYTLGLKHQVWKQKGEEYRMHGQLGWLWISSIKKQHIIKNNDFRITPKQIVMPVVHEGQEKTIKVQPATHEYLQRNLNSSNLNTTMTTNLESIKIPETFESLSVSKALNMERRVLFPKIGPDSKLNGLLSKREKLAELEMEDKLKDGVEIVSEETSKKSENNEQYMEQMLNKIIKSKSSTSDGSITKSTLLKRIQSVKPRYTELQRLSKQYKCYAKSCSAVNPSTSSNNSTCYSPICLQRMKVKNEMLSLLKKSHSGGTIPKEIMSIISSPTLSTDGNGVSDDSISLADDIRLAIQNAVSLDLKAFLEDVSQTDVTEQIKTKNNDIPSSDTEPILKDEPLKEEIKEEFTKDSKNEQEQEQHHVPKIERNLRTPRGRPPKASKTNQNGSTIVEEPPEVNIDNLKYNRRFPKIVLPPVKGAKKEVKCEPELFPDGRTKIYSGTNTKIKIYLRKLPVSNKKATTTTTKTEDQQEQTALPVPPSFRTTDGLKSILLLPKYELIKLARTGGKNYTSGFHYQAKTNTTIWPYPCPRPLFKTCWMYRSLTLNSYAAIALQLRILWTCLRWDDMTVKPTSNDGKHQITTETEIVSLELLKHRYVGRNLEKMQFLRRKVVIPLELPKTVRSEFTSTRLGLRKRKRADSPQHTEPQVTEEWIDEDKLELWEIKQYGERQERPKVLPITRTATGKLPPMKTSEIMVNSGKIIIKTEDPKEKLEQQLRAQRNVQIQKRANEMKQDDNSTPKQFVQRKVIIKNPDGTTKIINQTVAVAPPPPKPEQKVQIIRNPDGKITVRGLTAGQQLIQTSDGKLHVVNTNPVAPKNQTIGVPQVKTIVANKPNIITKPIVKPVTSQSNVKVVIAPNTGDGSVQQKKVIAPNLQQLLSPGGSQPKIILNQPTTSLQQKVIVGSNILTTSQSGGLPKQIIIQQPQSQQKIVLAPGTKIVQASGSTSQSPSGLIIGGQRLVLNTGGGTIQQNATKTIKTFMPNSVQQQQQQQSPSPANSSVARTQIVVPTQSLAQQISTGKVQIATVNGQQVLIRQTENNQAVVVAHVKQQSDGPAQVVPVTTTNPNKLGEQIQQSTTVVAVQPSSNNTISGLPQNIENSLLKGQPPGTVIKCVTAQVIQTQQGPRIVLQGLQGSDFTQQQSALVQQQVKQQLLKAQESNGKHGVLGPTKIYLAIQPSQGSSIPPLTPVQTTIQPNESSSEQNIGKDSTTEDSFVLTPDYIQQTIKSALQQENLNPEIEEKLLTLQRYQEKQMKNETPSKQDYGMPNNSLSEYEDVQMSRRRKSPSTRKRIVQHADDDDWVLDTPKKRPARPQNHAVENKRSTLVTSSTLKETTTCSKQENIINKTVEQQQYQKPQLVHQEKHQDTPVKKVPNKQQMTANKQKEHLKKEIHKKRSLLEKELLNEIQKEVALELSNNAQKEKTKQKDIRSSTSVKRKSNKFKEDNQTAVIDDVERDVGVSPTMNRKGTTKAKHTQGKSSKKKEKLYCICQTPYDDSRFYVGCDLCNNWFHGDCVGITEDESNSIDEFICKDCKHARDSQELYCLCRQPYDESQFYICCDLCNNWFHGRCVGILQSEAEFIDEYKCPNCQRNSSSSVANLKALNDREYEELRTLIKSIQNHKNAWPFLEPVDPNEVADYYKVIKEPMDLHTIEDKIMDHAYNSLQDFIGDMTKIFDNCRYYNPKESQFYKCAESLEAFFLQNIKEFREKICKQNQ